MRDALFEMSCFAVREEVENATGMLFGNLTSMYAFLGMVMMISAVCCCGLITGLHSFLVLHTLLRVLIYL